MKKQKLKELLEQTKVEIADELDSFIEKIDSSTDDPNNFLTMTELEKQWKELSLKTHKIYSDLVSKSLVADLLDCPKNCPIVCPSFS